MKKIIFIILCALIFIPKLKAQQGKLIDEIVGVVGENIILESDVQMEFEQVKKELPLASDSIK